VRILSLDVGDRRIGVAVSDPTGMMATPLTTVRRTELSSDIGALLRLAAESEAVEIVVGMPFSLSGHTGPQAKRVASFIDALSAQTSLPIAAVDERYSTVEAERLLREAGAKPSRNKDLVDASAAAVILQTYLDSRRATPAP
jgi:putative Holliday junction resolvase